MSRVLIGLATSIVVVLAIDAAVVLLHDSATPYGVDQAVSDFRSDSGSTAAPSPSPRPAPTGPVASASARPVSAAPTTATAGPSPSPASGASPVSPKAPPTVSEGVYRYATSGHEEVDVLGGSRHDYPAETAITYRRGGCGDEDRWQPLAERYSSNTVCRGKGGLEARSSVQRRQFFGQTEEQDLSCSAGIVLVPDSPRAGQTSSGSCRSDDTQVRLTVRVRGVAPMAVGRDSVRAVHVTVDATLTGATRGTTQREEWFDGAGLLLRSHATTETDRDTSAGVVHYSEVYDLRLESLAPQR